MSDCRTELEMSQRDPFAPDDKARMAMDNFLHHSDDAVPCPQRRDARNRKKTGHAARRFYSAIQQHDRSLDGCVADCVLRIRTGILGFDQRVRFDLTLGILRHARSARATEFQAYGHDLRGCDAVWKFLLFLPLWIGEFL